MKKYKILHTITLIVVIPMISIFVYLINSKNKKENTKKTVTTCIDECLELNKENLFLVLSKTVKHSKVVYQQVILETGHLQSKNAKTLNNLFGMKFPKKRFTTAIGQDKYGYAIYNTWEDCVIDYAYWQNFHNITDTEDYYNTLIKLGYAEDEKYINKLKNIRL